MYKEEKTLISTEEFQTFYEEYSKKFLIKEDLRTIKKTLVSSQILIFDDNYYKFGYTYILYFLVAKHISEVINDEYGRRELKRLFSNINNEESAKILVFITHHTRDLDFIEESLFTTLSTFENTPKITLETSGDFYKLIKDISKEVVNDVIELSRKPEEERKLILESMDSSHNASSIEQDSELENVINDDEEDFQEADEQIEQFLKAFRSIEVVGQIVKNRKGSLPKESLIELIKEVYFLSFRTINFVGDLINEAKSTFISQLLDDIEGDENKKATEKRVIFFFQIFTMKICMAMFDKLVYAVGIKDLKSIYNEVAKSIGTPAADLVSFSINSYYNDVSANEIKELADKYKKNQVVYQLLRAKAKSYIYNNHVDARKKQKIAEYLNFKITPQMIGKTPKA